MSDSRANKIQVCVRLRPLNEREKEKEKTPIVTASSVHNTVTVVRGKGKTAVRHGARYLFSRPGSIARDYSLIGQFIFSTEI